MAALLAALALGWAPGGATAQERPAWVAQARQAMVVFANPGQGSNGVLVAPDKMVTFYHVLNRRSPLKVPGRQGVVEFRGYWESLSPENQGRVIRDRPDLIRKAHVLCAIEAADIVWVQLDEPAPSAVIPLTVSRRLVTPLWVLPNVPWATSAGGRDIIRAFLLGEGTVTLEGLVTGRKPFLRYENAESVRGWSGSPIVNADGELLGLQSGFATNGDRRVEVMTAWIPPCR